jgi:hypothetical protein
MDNARTKFYQPYLSVSRYAWPEFGANLIITPYVLRESPLRNYKRADRYPSKFREVKSQT